MLDATRLSHILKTALPILLITWTLWFLSGGPAPNYHEVLRQFKGQRRLFVADVLENEVGGPLDGSAISEVCVSKNWTQGLIVSCDPGQGGVGHVRNSHLNCIRLAIEAGAELILPDIVRRSESNIEHLTKSDPKGPLRGSPLSYLFDLPHLLTTLNTHCPQMKVYTSLGDLANVPSVQKPISLEPMPPAPKFPPPSDPSDPTEVMNVTSWYTHFKTWLDEKSPPDKRRYPLRIHAPALHFYWPVLSDGVEFASTFGKILRPNEDARRLGAAALFEMEKRYQWGWEPRKEVWHPEGFVGVHLRTERDAGGGRFPEYAEQGANYLSYAASSNLTIAFLAHGLTATNVDAFKARAKEFGIEVLEKRDLLEPQDVGYLNRMTFDQQGLVDWEVLMRAGRMTGPSGSTFSFNVALRRGTMGVGGGYGLKTKGEYPEGSGEGDGVQVEVGEGKDERDVLVGFRGTDKDGEGQVRWEDEFGVLYGSDVERARIHALGMWP